MEKYKDRVFELLETLSKARSVLIATHSNPDPDSLASAFGIRHLLTQKAKIRAAIGYSGIIGRAENRLMVSLLRINAAPFSKLKHRKFKGLILCDSQPAGDSFKIFNKKLPDVVLDHHPIRSRKKIARFTDIRMEYGSTSTIVTEYLREADVPMNARVATALYYGIKTDISDLARQKSEADLEALKYLFPKISVRWLYRIEHPRVPRDYFMIFSEAIQGARVYRDAVVTCLGEVPRADYVAEIADFLLKLEGMKWAFSVGCAGDEMVFSIRTLARGKQAGRIASKLVRNRGGSGGGHNMSAAGRLNISDVPEEKRYETCMNLLNRFLTSIGRDPASGKTIGGKDLIHSEPDLP